MRARVPIAFASAVCAALLAGAAAVGAEERAFARYGTEQMALSLSYPQFGHARVDAALASFARQELARYAQDMEREFGQAEPGHGKLVKLEGSYTLFRPSSQAVSVLFELRAMSPRWPAPRYYYVTRSYSLPAGEELTLACLFENISEALDVLARKCSPKLLAEILAQQFQKRIEIVWFLRTRLIMPGYPMPDGADIAEFSERGGDAPAMRLLESVVRGTRAEAGNYKHFLLTPEGLRIQFDPLQLGGPELGTPYVDLSLKELQNARPYLKLWGK